MQSHQERARLSLVLAIDSSPVAQILEAARQTTIAEPRVTLAAKLYSIRILSEQ